MNAVLAMFLTVKFIRELCSLRFSPLELVAQFLELEEIEDLTNYALHSPNYLDVISGEI